MQADIGSHTMQVIKATLRNEGFFGFFKGMSSPITMLPLVNAIMFTSYEYCKKRMGVKSEDELTFKQSLIAGAFAGLCNTPIVAASELVKCRMQVQTQSRANSYYKNSLDCLNSIILDEGPRSVFKGTFATAAREVPNIIATFSCYYVIKRLWANYIQGGVPVNDINFTGCFVAGGISGWASWAVSYPQDVIKTKLQIAQPG
jgi:solute carrier family 25 carnitine/acylcarnitine transporter 20/29